MDSEHQHVEHTSLRNGPTQAMYECFPFTVMFYVDLELSVEQK